eukprot:symbB.v1.2.006864.t1/scaffold415.1/size208980/7
MLQIHVALPNGHAELLTLLPSSTLQDVWTKAKQAFGKKHLRLVTAKNQVLVDFEQTLEEAEIEDGECLTALVLQPQLAATNSAFALWCHGDSAMVTWGNARCGGDNSEVQDQLKGVQQIQATESAFAAILEDGSVVIWGDADRGGDSSAVRDQLRGVCSRSKPQDTPLLGFLKMDPGVQQIQASHGAFAAILEDGNVVTWGRADYGGDSSAVQDQLKGISHWKLQPGDRCQDLIPNLQSMIAGCDADANGKVSVSELGFAADMVVSAVEGVESKEDVIKRFDKNGDGMLSKEEINKVAEGVALSLQYKMAQVMLLQGEDAKFEDDDTKARWAECKKQLEAYSPPE